MNKLNYWRSEWLFGGLNRAKAMSEAMMLGGATDGGHCGSNKALAKDPVAQYQDGGQIAKALLLCLQSLSAHGAPAATAAVGTGA